MSSGLAMPGPAALWALCTGRVGTAPEPATFEDGLTAIVALGLLGLGPVIFLHLALRVSFPVVLVGAQRPATGLSADGPLNMVNALRTAVHRSNFKRLIIRRTSLLLARRSKNSTLSIIMQKNL